MTAEQTLIETTREKVVTLAKECNDYELLDFVYKLLTQELSK